MMVGWCHAAATSKDSHMYAKLTFIRDTMKYVKHVEAVEELDELDDDEFYCDNSSVGIQNEIIERIDLSMLYIVTAPGF
jgi:hypothetical protein